MLHLIFRSLWSALRYFFTSPYLNFREPIPHRRRGVRSTSNRQFAEFWLISCLLLYVLRNFGLTFTEKASQELRKRHQKARKLFERLVESGSITFGMFGSACIREYHSGMWHLPSIFVLSTVCITITEDLSGTTTTRTYFARMRMMQW